MRSDSKSGSVRLSHHLVLVATLTIFVSLASPAFAIENGRPDGPRHQNVGLLGIDLDGSDGPLPPVAFCSGFVLSDSLFATAAHCIESFGTSASWVVTLEPGSPTEPIYRPGIFDPSVFNIMDFPVLGDVERARFACMHPAYDPVTFQHDLAVLTFDEDTFQVDPVQLPVPGWLDHLAEGPLTHMPLDIVGYGTEGRVGSSGFPAPGYRKTATTAITGLGQNWLQFAPNEVWVGDTGFGDSGSPQFLTGRAVSLLTFPAHLAQRLDTTAELEFLNQMLADGCSG
jgi:hypothetical protein